MQVSFQYHHWFWRYDNLLYKGLTRNAEIRISPVWVFPSIGDWGKLELPILVQMSLIKCYKLLQNARVAVFTWVIKGKSTGVGRIREDKIGGGRIKLLFSTKIRVNILITKLRLFILTVILLIFFKSLFVFFRHILISYNEQVTVY